jgi:hypothetical protein
MVVPRTLQTDVGQQFLRKSFCALSTLDYREVPLHPNRSVRLQRQRGVQQVADSPDPIRNTERNARRSSQGLVNAAEVVVGNVQAHGGLVVRQLL